MIGTARLRLEPVTEDHLVLLTELNADPEVMRFILGRAATPDQTRAEWRQRLDHQSDATRGLGYWVGFEGSPHGGEFVGWWSASAFEADPTTAGLGYRLRRAAWGRGLATEGALAMVDQAFACPDVETIVASTMSVNLASRAVLARAGLRHARTWVERWDEPIPGWEEGEVAYELTRAEWAARRTSS